MLSDGTGTKFTLDDLREILVNQAGIGPVVDLEPHETWDNLGIDSLAFLEVQVELQQRYGMEISEGDAAVLTTPQSAVDYVNRHLNQN